MRANRAFLGRVVRFLAAQAGIRQFLDIGSGIPTENAVHQVAQDAAPGSRVVYVDNNDVAVAVAHSRLLLDGNPDASVIQGDLREPAKILADPGTQLLLDFTQPVAVFLVAVMHFLPDTGQAADIVATLRDALAPGSYLVICHACRDEQPSLATSFETVRTGPGLDTPMAPRLPRRRSRGPVQVLGPGRRRPLRRPAVPLAGRGLT